MMYINKYHEALQLSQFVWTHTGVICYNNNVVWAIKTENPVRSGMKQPYLYIVGSCHTEIYCAGACECLYSYRKKISS